MRHFLMRVRRDGGAGIETSARPRHERRAAPSAAIGALCALALFAAPSAFAQGYGGYQDGGGYGGNYGGYQQPQGNYGGYQQPPGNYGGYGAPGGDAAGSGNPTVRIDQLQQQIQDLTGRIEELSHQLQVLSRRVTDLEKAPPAAAGAPAPAYPSTGPEPGPGTAYPANPDEGDYMGGARQPYPPVNGGGPGPSSDLDSDLMGPSGTGTPPRTLGTVPLTGGGTQLPVRGTPPAANSPEAEYDQAIALLRTENYSGAQGAFKQFLAKNPDSSLAGNAQYWLGESYYAQGQYRNAAEAFLQGFQKYPKSSKASASLLKLGMSLGQLKQTKEACLTLNEIPKRYPDAPAMLRQKADEERKKLHCS